MDDRSPRVAEYFVVAGLQDTSRLQEEDMQNDSGLKPSKPKGPITDVAVIIKSQAEKVPQDFECLETTPSGFQADLNHGSLRSPAVYLCYRRGFDKPPLTDIGILLEGKERVMSGCEIVSTTPYGRPANINNRTGMGNQRIYITYRRASDTAAHNSLAVTDICVILTNKGEMPPHAFCMIDKNLNKGMTGSDVYLCYKKSMTRANAITYRAGIISRYPEKDYETTPLPESVPLFGLPLGASIECWSAKRNHPLPVFSTFVLTDSQAVKMYGAAVTFYEKYDESKLDEEQKKRLGLITDPDDPYRERRTVHTNKCILVLSLWPFFDAFKKFLSYLYRLSVSGPHHVPIERHITHFMHEVPFPTAQRPRIMMPLAHDSLYLVQPQTTPLPLSGASYTALLRNLGPENCLALLLFAVTEHKILLHSLRPAVLTSIAEAVSTMISPFTWQCPYIPLCPLSLSAVLNAPIPFIVGVDSRYFDIYEPPTDVVCVDLDTNTISQSDERRFMNWKMLPKKAAKQLRHTLARLCTELYTVPAYSETDDTMVEMAPLNPDFSRKKKQLAMEISIQEAYLRFMAAILHGYKHYLLPITQQPSERTTDPSSLFNLQGFLKSRDKANHKFFTQLMRTQTFIHFIEQRSFVSSNDASLAFFDECIDKVDPECKVETKLIEMEDAFGNERTVFVTPPEPITNMEYRYTCFPEFKKELFELHFSMQNLAVHKAVSRTSIPSSPMIRRTKQEVKLAQQSAKKNASNPRLWAKCLLGYCFSAWFIHLPAFVRSTHSKTKALRTAFERLIVMGSYRLEPPDEICYRVLMQLCGQFGQPVLAVKVLMEMRKSGVQPNAITYGFYNRAVLESKWPATTSSGYILWTKLRNVIMAVAQFRRKLKGEPDGFSQCSSDSYNDEETVTDHVTDLIKLDSPIATDDKSSTGGHSDMGYGSMCIDDGSRSDNTLSSQKSATESDMCQSEESLKESNKKSVKATISPLENGQGDSGRFDPLDISHHSTDGLRPRVNSIVRNSVGSFGSASSMGTLRGSTSSAAGLLITSQHSLDVEESVFDTASEANLSKVRKRHKSAGDHITRHNRNLLRNRNFSGESTTTITLAIAKDNSTESDPGLIKADSFAFDARILEGLTSSDPKLDSPKTNIQKVKKSTKFNLDELDFEEEAEDDIVPSYIRRSNSEGQNPIHARRLMERNKRRKEEQMKAKEKQQELMETKCSEEISVKEEEMPRTDSNLEIILQEFDEFSPGKDREDSPELDSEGDGELNSEEAERARSSSISIKNKPFHEDHTSIQIKSSSFDDSADLQWGSGELMEDIPHSLPNPELPPGTPPQDFQRQDSKNSDKLPQRSFSSNFLQGLIQQVAQSPQTPTWFGSSPFSKKGNDGSASSSRLDALKAAASAVANKIGSYTKQAKSMTLPLATAAKSSTSSIPQDVEDSESLLSFKDGTDSKHGMWVHSNSDTNLVGQLLDEWFPPPLLTGSTPSLNGPFGDPPDTPFKQTTGSQGLFNHVMEVNVSSCSRCTKCNTLLHDEAIMAGWSADDSNLNTTCCFCGSQFVPFLYVTIRDLRSVGFGRSIISPSQSSESMQSIQSAPSSQQAHHTAKNQDGSVSSAENLLHDTGQIPEEEDGDEARDSLRSDTPRQLRYIRNLSSPGDLLMAEEEEVDGSAHSKSEPRVIRRPPKADARRRCTSECHTSTTETYRDDKRHRYSTPAGSDFPGADEDLLSSSLSSSIQGSREYLPPQRKNHNPDPVAVPYLSPLVLRKEMENVIENEGEHCLLSADFVDKHPIIFWNLIWVYKRLDLPSNLPGLILSANSINKDNAPTNSQWLSRDSRHVLVNVVWDTLKAPEELGQPMYVMWNAIQQGSPLVNALVTEQQPFNRQFMQNVVSSIQCNDVLTPIKWMLEQYRKRPGQHRHWSIYRDLLFLALVACGRENIDIDAFDREYEIAFERLIEEYWGPKQLEKLQEDDKPLSDAVFWCRKVFSEAGELKL